MRYGRTAAAGASPPRPKPAIRLLPVLALPTTLFFLAGCGSTAEGITSDIGALGVGTAVGAATGNPVIGLAAGVGVRIAAEEGYNYAERAYYGSLQGAVAAAGGMAEPGDVVYWDFDNFLELGPAGGRIEVVREFGEVLRCKEVIFTFEPGFGDLEVDGIPVATDRPPPSALASVDELPLDTEIFTTTICDTPRGWAWAAPRPSTDLWGGLQ